jgi:four helix bundle protein
MPEIRDFTDLLVWQKAIQLGKIIYRLTCEFPKEEKFGLTSQVRRAAVSVASNIAEGHARQGKEFAHFLSIARGSLAETESQLLFAVEIGYLKYEAIIPIRALASEIHRMSSVLATKLASNSPRPSPLAPRP